MTLDLSKAVDYFRDKELELEMAEECKRLLFCISSAQCGLERKDLFLGMPKGHEGFVGNSALNYLISTGYITENPYNITIFTAKLFAA